MTQVSLKPKITEETIRTEKIENNAEEKRKESGKKWSRSFRLYVTVPFLFYLLLLAVGFTSHYIPSSSMLPTLKIGDHTLTMKSWLAYPLGKMPKRGDIVIFKLQGKQEKLMYGDAPDPLEKTDILIKRVIGLPGDTVQFLDNIVTINGKKLDEPWATLPSESNSYPFAGAVPITISEDEVFVLGDNRDNSDDGRFWGTLPRKDIVGRYIITLYHKELKDPEEKTDHE